MSIWAKVVTAVRGGVNEAGEAIVDHQALRILDQEIRDADDNLSKSKVALTGIIAKRKLSDKKVESLKSSVEEYEGYAIQALDKGDETLATEIAEKIAGLETELIGEEGMAKSFATSDIRTYGPVRKMPYAPIFDDLQLGIYCTEEMDVKKTIF